jgi:hypothetical protein
MNEERIGTHISSASQQLNEAREAFENPDTRNVETTIAKLLDAANDIDEALTLLEDQ